MRIIKAPEERKNEILDIAETLFITNGYTKTTVNDILDAIGISKGAFYYYFESKEEVMNAIVMRFISVGVEKAKIIAVDADLSVYEKLLKIIMAQKPDGSNKQQMTKELHQINNAEIHIKSLVETILQLSPVMTDVLEQGIEEGLFTTPYPRESMDFILAASHFIFDEHLFEFSPVEFEKKVNAFIYTMEATLGAEKGSFDYLSIAFE